MKKTTPISQVGLWLLAIRPKTLPAAVGPIAVGTAVAAAEGGFSLLPALVCLISALLLQVGVNLANDYFDFKNKIDSGNRLGPVRVTQSGLIPPGRVKMAMMISLGLAVVLSFYLIRVGGWPVIAIGTASVLCALAYSGGPWPLASHGLGDGAVFIFFGPVAVIGTCYVQTLEFSLFAATASISPGLLITAILVVNNFRDMETDRAAGKNTLAVYIGRGAAMTLYRTLLAGSYLAVILMPVFNMAGWPVLLPVLSLFHAWRLGHRIGHTHGPDLNRLLADTAMLSLVFSLLFSAGIVSGAM